MDFQVGFNIAVLIAGAFGGWFLKSLDDRFKELKVTDEEHAKKIQAIELLVAGQYVKRDSFDAANSAILKKLEEMSVSLNALNNNISNKITAIETRCKMAHFDDGK